MVEPRVIMHIDADAFFASVEQGFNPALRNRPVIVGGLAEQRGVVHTASYEARARGIYTGMPLVKAHAVCPEAVFFKGDQAHYQAASKTMRRIYQRYTPRVEFTSLDDAYLDLSGTESLYGSPVYVARRIGDDVGRELGISVSSGIGSSKMIARIASGLKKPAGIVHVVPEDEHAFLKELSVEHLPGIGRVTREKLADLGIFKVGDLAGLPRLIVDQLFGRNGSAFWEMANGNDARMVRENEMPRQISRETSFEKDTADSPMILAMLQYLCERIARKLQHGGWSCGTVGLKIGYADFTRHARSRSLGRASDDPMELFVAAKELFRQMARRRVRIRHLGMRATRLQRRENQHALFYEVTRREELNLAVEELRSRYGFMSVMPADTLKLKSTYRNDVHGYILHNPALTR